MGGRQAGRLGRMMRVSLFVRASVSFNEGDEADGVAGWKACLRNLLCSQSTLFAVDKERERNVERIKRRTRAGELRSLSVNLLSVSLSICLVIIDRPESLNKEMGTQC